MCAEMASVVGSRTLMSTLMAPLTAAGRASRAFGVGDSDLPEIGIDSWVL